MNIERLVLSVFVQGESPITWNEIVKRVHAKVPKADEDKISEALNQLWEEDWVRCNDGQQTHWWRMPGDRDSKQR